MIILAYILSVGGPIFVVAPQPAAVRISSVCQKLPEVTEELRAMLASLTELEDWSSPPAEVFGWTGNRPAAESEPAQHGVCEQTTLVGHQFQFF